MKAIRTGATPSTLDALEWLDLSRRTRPRPGRDHRGAEGEQPQLPRLRRRHRHDPDARRDASRCRMEQARWWRWATASPLSRPVTARSACSSPSGPTAPHPPPPSGACRATAIDGYARQQVTVPASWFTRAPAGYSHAEAATLSCAGLTAWRALFVDNAIKPGDIVLVQGTGGVSIFALQFAKAAGARVVATSSSSRKAGAAARHGRGRTHQLQGGDRPGARRRWR